VTVYLELADYLLIAERVLGLPAEAIANFDRIGLAESALAAPQTASAASRRTWNSKPRRPSCAGIW
jgi:hypothetical protein